MRRKLRKKSGETLVETLVSLLIAFLSIGMLSSCLMAATRINMQTRAADEQYNQELQRAEGLMEEEGYEAEKVEVELIFSTQDKQTILVELYGGEEGAFIAYDYEIEESTP